MMRGKLGIAGVCFGIILLAFVVFVLYVTFEISVLVGPEVIVPGTIVAFSLLLIAVAFIYKGVK